MDLNNNSDIINDIINIKNFYNDDENDNIVKLNDDTSSNLVLEINDNNLTNNSQYEWKPELNILNNDLIHKNQFRKNYVVIDSDSESNSDSNSNSDLNLNGSPNLSDFNPSPSLKFKSYEMPPPINYEHVKKGVHINNNSSNSYNSSNNENILKSYKMLKKDLDDDLKMFNDLISNQNYYRITLFKRVLNSYLKISKSNNDTEFHSKVIQSIKYMGHILGLYNTISSLLCELLFTKNINKENEINKYIDFIIPFLDTHQLQENLLNQILILIDNYNQLFDEKEIIDIFHFILNKKIININILYNWYNKLDDDNFELHNKLNIKYDIPKAVYIFLDNIITELIENSENSENEQYNESEISI
jgi:hypothetical protein